MSIFQDLRFVIQNRYPLLTRSRLKKQLWFGILILLCALYFPSLNSPFTLDDFHTLDSNGGIQTISNWAKVWTSGKYYSSNPATWGYRPVTTFINLLLWNTGTGSTWPFHLFKILLFWATCFLLANIWRRLLPYISEKVLLFGLLFFILNPVHSQVVIYIPATATLLAAFFICAAVETYLKFRGTGKKTWFLLSLLSSLLAVLSKEEGIVFLALIPLTELYLCKIENKKLEKKSLWTFAFYVLPAVIGVGLIIYMYEPMQSLARGDLSPWHYFMTQWRAYIRYFVMYFVSYDLNLDNLEFGFSKYFFSIGVLSALIGNLVLIGLSLYYRNRFPFFIFGLAWFYIGISPGSSIVALAEPVNDHRAFIGYLGFGVLLVGFMNFLFQRFKATPVILSFILAIFCGLTFQRALVWSTAENLWRDTVTKNPSSARALNNLAVDLIRQSKPHEALVVLEKCKEKGSQYSNCYVNMAIVNAMLGRDQEAEKNFAAAVPLDIVQVQARTKWAEFCRARGFYERAFKLYSEVDKITQGNQLQVRTELTLLASQMGNSEQAKSIWTDTLQRFGSHPNLITIGKNLSFISD